MREEIFGPVLVVQTFDDEADAVRMANDTVYGLAGAVFTQDVAKAHRVIRKLRAGITWINTYHPTYNEAPWGGYKQSGFGSELGTYGYDAYTEVKQINVNLDVAAVGLVRRISASEHYASKTSGAPHVSVAMTVSSSSGAIVRKSNSTWPPSMRATIAGSSRRRFAVVSAGCPTASAIASDGIRVCGSAPPPA